MVQGRHDWVFLGRDRIPYRPLEKKIPEALETEYCFFCFRVPYNNIPTSIACSSRIREMILALDRFCATTSDKYFA